LSKGLKTSWIPAWGGNVGNKPTQPSALLSYETIQRINEWGEAEHCEQATNPPRRLDLGHERETPTTVAGNGGAVAPGRQ